jgi:hypothetical protein
VAGGATGLGQHRPLNRSEDLQYLGVSVRRGQDPERSDDHGVSSYCSIRAGANLEPAGTP